jgi:hypothetical protein
MSKDENYVVLDKCHDGKDTIQVIESMRNTITNQALLLEEIINHCDDEVKINEEYHWSTMGDGTDGICRGRLEFAESILTKVENWRGNENE